MQAGRQVACKPTAQRGMHSKAGETAIAIAMGCGHSGNPGRNIGSSDVQTHLLRQRPVATSDHNPYMGPMRLCTCSGRVGNSVSRCWGIIAAESASFFKDALRCTFAGVAGILVGIINKRMFFSVMPGLLQSHLLHH